MLGWLLGGFILFILGVVPIMAVIGGSKAEKGLRNHMRLEKKFN